MRAVVVLQRKKETSFEHQHSNPPRSNSPYDANETQSPWKASRGILSKLITLSLQRRAETPPCRLNVPECSHSEVVERGK